MTTTTVNCGEAPPCAPGDVLLRELHIQGQLVDSYPEVPRLLAGLDDPALLRAGAVLAQLEPDLLLRRHPHLPMATVAVTGSSTTRPLASPLSAQLARHGFIPRIQVGGYRQYAIELRETSGALFATEPDVTVCLLDADEVFGRLRTPWTPADVEHALREVNSGLARLADAYLGYHRGTLVFNTIPLPRRWAAQLIDHRSRALLGAAWREFNAQLLRFAADQPGVVVLDVEPLLGESGPLADPRSSRYADVQFSDSFFAAYAREIGHLIRSTSGRSSKCLVVDLDGTMWGGVLAEDGPEGIEISGGFRGEAFHAFQTAVKQLGSQGALIAVCSKNDEQDVRAVLNGPWPLALRADDLVAIVANWGAKPDNLLQLAEQLGIAVDSLVFVDDSPAERGLVREVLPTVPVIDVDADEPALHVHRLLADGWFVTQEVTDEDRARGRRYLTDEKRLKFRERTESLADYLAGLGTAVELFHATAGDATRVAQLTQRTNQFNCTTIRLDTPAVLQIMADPNAEVICVRCADRFGEHGTVGVVLASWSGQVLCLDNFLLSCRVLARGVESACLRAVLTHAKRAGAVEVEAAFRPTPRNQRVKNFYSEHGFKPIEQTADTARFSHDLIELPPHARHVDVNVRLAQFSRRGANG